MISVAVLFCLALGVPPADYGPLGETSGVAVYRRRHSQVIDLYAEGRIDAPPERVRQVLLDYDHHATYFQRMAEVRVLSRQADALLVYQRVRMPMLADRDMILEIRWGADGPALWTRFRIAPGAVGPPLRKGVVRVTDHEGGWRLQPIDGGQRTVATYQVRIDLAGSLPRWLARAHAGGDMAGLFEAIRRQVRAAP